MKNGRLIFGALAVWSITVAGCSRPSAATAAVAGDASRASTTPASPAPAAAKPAGKLAKVVFVGEEHGCPCRQARLDAGWAALQQAMGTPPKLPVEKIHVDTQSAKVQVFTQQKPILTMPGIFLVDSADKMLDMLQGDITRVQIDAAIAALTSK
jgi:hypothetical protein